jgi:hypothetical protein
MVVRFIYGGIKKALAAADPVEPIRIALAPGKTGGEITITYLSRREQVEESPQDMTAAFASRLGGSIEETESDGRHTIRLTIPYDG